MRSPHLRDWCPMGNAPKDGTAILLLHTDGRMAVGKWKTGPVAGKHVGSTEEFVETSYWVFGMESVFDESRIRFWMPLPVVSDSTAEIEEKTAGSQALGDEELARVQQIADDERGQRTGYTVVEERGEYIIDADLTIGRTEEQRALCVVPNTYWGGSRAAYRIARMPANVQFLLSMIAKLTGGKVKP